jgi:hypothetical protein
MRADHGRRLREIGATTGGISAVGDHLVTIHLCMEAHP